MYCFRIFLAGLVIFSVAAICTPVLAIIISQQSQDANFGLDPLAETYRKLGKYREELELEEKALQKCIDILGEKHPITVRSMCQLAVTYRKLGRYSEALSLNEKALQLSTEILGERDRDTISIMGSLANAYGDLGRYNEQLALHEKVFTLFMEIEGEKSDTISSMNNLAIAYGNLGNYNEALALKEKVLKLRTALLGERHLDTVRSMNNLANTYWDLGRYSDALALREKVVKLRTEILGEKHPDTIRSISSLAVSYCELRKFHEAQALGEKAVELSKRERGEWHPNTFVVQHNLADTYKRMGQNSAAVSLLQTVLNNQRQVLGDQHPNTLATVASLAEAYYSGRHFPEATALMHEAVDRVESLREAGAMPQADRLSFFAKYAGWYKMLVRWYVEQNNFSEAFFIAEQAKARTLLESTSARMADQSGILMPEETSKIQDYQYRLAAYDDLIGKAIADNNLSAQLNVKAERSVLWREYQNFRSQLLSKYEKYKEMNHSQVVGAIEGAQLLPTDAVFISYIVADKSIIAFVLKPHSKVVAVPIGVWTTLADITLFNEIIGYNGIEAMDKKGRHLWKKADGTYIFMAAGTGEDKQVIIDEELFACQRLYADHLGNILLKPLLPHVAGAGKWIISGDDALALLPFETLRLEGKEVVLDRDISYTQSLSMLALLKKREEVRRNSKMTGTFLAFGSALYDGNAGNVRGDDELPVSLANQLNSPYGGTADGIRNVLKNLKWSNLPYSELEVERIAALFANDKVAVYKKADATEAMLQELNKQKRLAEYRNILFSTHGYVNPANPSLNSVVLGQQNLAPGTDGYITAGEWTGYDLRSDLIFLSACSTARGKLIQGEGVFGLPFALYVAGNKNSVMTLWPVWDDSTAAFSTRFFTKVREGQTHIQAINAVKREFIKEGTYSLPVYWAPFVLYGM